MLGIPGSSPATGGFPLVGDGDADVVELLDMLVSTSSLPAGSLERGIVCGKEEEEEGERAIQDQLKACW